MGCVAAEFRGLARNLRNQVEAAEQRVRPALQSISAPLKRRLAQHPRLRAEQIVDAEREWRRLMPVEFRIGDIVVKRSRDAFAISEIRLVGHRIRFPRWTEDESGVALYRNGVQIINGRLMPVATRVTTAIGLHAMARRYERGVGRTDDSVLADLALLAGPDPDELRVAGWAAEIVTVESALGDRYPLRSVRTWISS